VTSRVVYYVVVRGVFPGVYNNVYAISLFSMSSQPSVAQPCSYRASKAAGVDLLTSKGNHRVVVEVFDVQAHAEDFFQKARADGLVEEIDD
jgi:hypothetical protein